MKTITESAWDSWEEDGEGYYYPAGMQEDDPGMYAIASFDAEQITVLGKKHSARTAIERSAVLASARDKLALCHRLMLAIRAAGAELDEWDGESYVVGRGETTLSLGAQIVVDEYEKFPWTSQGVDQVIAKVGGELAPGGECA